MMAVNKPYPDRKLNGLEEYGSRNTDWNAWPDDIQKTAEYRTAEYAIQKLQQNFDQPFFLNVGITNPIHLSLPHRNFLNDTRPTG